MAIVNIALGSNIGDPKQNLSDAVSEIRQLGDVVSKSRLYQTKPWEITDQADFCNAVVQINTSLGPRLLLKELKDIECRMGRIETVRNGPRLIDLDILTYDDVSIDEPGLTIPHPRMIERAFVLIPLRDVDPSYARYCELLPRASVDDVELLAEEWAMRR